MKSRLFLCCLSLAFFVRVGAQEHKFSVIMPKEQQIKIDSLYDGVGICLKADYSIPKIIQVKVDSLYPNPKETWWIKEQQFYQVEVKTSLKWIHFQLDTLNGGRLEIFTKTPNMEQAVPQNIQNKFDSIYPNVPHIEWDTLHNDSTYCANFYRELEPGVISERNEVVFDKQGKITHLAVTPLNNLVTSKIKIYIRKKYPKENIKEPLTEYIDGHGNAIYQVALSKIRTGLLANWRIRRNLKVINLTFNCSGTLMRESADREWAPEMRDPF